MKHQRISPARPVQAGERPAPGPSAHRLGLLSEKYESGGRGCGTVSTGKGDPGGVSYGLYQLASRTGTVAAFVRSEGRRWAADLPGEPGSESFSTGWRRVAASDAEAFADAQHAFVERTHYRPVITAVLRTTGYALDHRADALRDVVWSTAVQHASAPRIVTEAVHQADAVAQRNTSAHDRALIEAVYRLRTAHVMAIARRSSPLVRRTLTQVCEGRYPDERAAALAMLAASY